MCIAIISTLLAACSSSSGGGNGHGIRASGPPSLSSVPVAYRDSVSDEKTISLVNRITQGRGIDVYRYNLDGKTDEYNFSDLPNGRTDLPVSLSYESQHGVMGKASGTMLIYQQPYSVITGITYTQQSGEAFEDDEIGFFSSHGIPNGFSTPASAFAELAAQNAIFDYQGVAFDGRNEQGTLNYKMNFASQKGQGSITGFSRTGLIDLQVAQINHRGIISGQAYLEGIPANQQDAQYELSFFGPDAEELAGYIYDAPNGSFLGNSQIIFAGKRATN